MNYLSRGISLPIALAFLLLASIMGVGALRTASLEEKKSRTPADKLVAQAAAQAALRDAITLLNPAYNVQTGVQDLDSRAVPQILGPWDGTSEITVSANTVSTAATLPTRDNYATTTFANAVCATAFGHPGGCPATSFDSAWYSYGRKPSAPVKGTAPAYIFTAACDGGLCLNNGSGTDPWSDILNQASSKRIDYGAKTQATALTGVSQQPYYIIEYLGNKSTITETFDGTDRKTLADSVPLTYATVYTATPTLLKSIGTPTPIPTFTYGGSFKYNYTWVNNSTGTYKDYTVDRSYNETLLSSSTSYPHNSITRNRSGAFANTMKRFRVWDSSFAVECPVTQGYYADFENSGDVSMTVSDCSALTKTKASFFDLYTTVTGLPSGSRVIAKVNNGNQVYFLQNYSTPVLLQTGIPKGSYTVTVESDNASCTVVNGSGSITNKNITNIQITCAERRDLFFTEEIINGPTRTYANPTNSSDNVYASNILRKIPGGNFKNMKTCWDTFGYWSANGLQCTYATSFAGTKNQAMLDGAKDDGTTRSGYGTSGETALDTLKGWEGTSATQTTFGALNKTNFILTDGGQNIYHHEKDIECIWTARNRNNFELGATGDKIRGFPSCLSLSTKNNWGGIDNELLYLRPNHEYKTRYRITAVGFGAVSAKVIMQQEVYVEAMRWGGLTTTEAALTSSDTNYPAESCDEPDVSPVVTQTWNTTTRTWDVSVSYPTGWNFYGYPRASLVNMNTWGHAKQVFVPENVKCSHWLGRRTMLRLDPEAPGSIGGINTSRARYIYVRPRIFKAFNPRRLL